jgi:transmembrane sensor
MWRHIGAAPNRTRSPATGRHAWALAGATVAAAAAALAVVWLARPSEPGPLSRASGESLPATLRATQGPERVALSDGSRLRLERDSRLETVHNSKRTLELVLHHGEVRFEVEPGGARRWRIHAGELEVQVVGTVFTVNRRDDSSSVHVERGEVLVRGDSVPDGVTRLTAGQRFTGSKAKSPATSETAATQEQTKEPPDASIQARDDSKRDDSRPDTEAPEPQAPRARAPNDGRRPKAREHAPPTAREGPTVNELLARADDARLSGDPARAVPPLRTILERHPDHPKAGLAAFTLGRLQLQALQQPAKAAASFQRALQLGVADPLRESVRARRVQALVGGGDPRAEEAAQAYLEDFPRGRYREQVKRWIGEP